MSVLHTCTVHSRPVGLYALVFIHFQEKYNSCDKKRYVYKTNLLPIFTCNKDVCSLLFN